SRAYCGQSERHRRGAPNHRQEPIVRPLLPGEAELGGQSAHATHVLGSNGSAPTRQRLACDRTQQERGGKYSDVGAAAIAPQTKALSRRAIEPDRAAPTPDASSSVRLWRCEPFVWLRGSLPGVSPSRGRPRTSKSAPRPPTSVGIAELRNGS